MHKHFKPSTGLLIFAGLIILLNSCEEIKPNLPAVTTSPATEITYTTVVTGGNITDHGGADVTSRGVCWATTVNPDISGSHTTDGAGTGIYTSNLEGLTAGLTYYLRAYATNSAGTAYGNEVTFATTATTAATVSTDVARSTAFNTAVAGGIVTGDGGDPITARGVCWSTGTGPLVSGPHTTDGTGIGTFTSSITGLLSFTKYYVRAYATNSNGTTYGEEGSFTTLLGDVDGNSYEVVTIGDQVWMAENLATTSLNNGTAISNVSVATDWEAGSSAAYAWYDNDEVANKSRYGALYNWYAVESSQLCPAGWHVSSEADWNILISYLGGIDVAGGKLKEAGTANWLSPNTGATNEKGFSALAGGGRRPDGNFDDQGRYGVWWTSTPGGGFSSRGLTMSNQSSSIFIGYSARETGGAIRCLKD